MKVAATIPPASVFEPYFTNEDPEPSAEEQDRSLLNESNISLPPLEAIYNQQDNDMISDTHSLPAATPSKKSIRNLRKNKQQQNTQPVDEEGDMTAYTVHVNQVQSNDVFIIDTGCIGSHVFKNKNLLSNISRSTSRAIKDFSGTSHSSTDKLLFCPNMVKIPKSCPKSWV
jgi:hypothetical protein